MKNKKQVGIWIRVSTDMQVKDESPEIHEKRARSYAELKEWEVVEAYRLEAVSGKSLMEHPETKRMLKDIKSGRISALIFSKLARLARNTKELLEFADFFKQNNADLISIAESIDTSSPAGRFFYTIIAAMATWEREEIAERIAASVPIRASLGKPLGGQATFGYRWNGKTLAIDEKEAPVRKLIYELFLKYKRKKTVVRELNSMGYRTRNGYQFSDTTVTRLLRDPTAKGIRIANYTKSMGKNKKWVFKPESDWVQLPCEALIEPNEWDECNNLLDKLERRRENVGPKVSYLLSGFVYCSCGKKMYVYYESPIYKCKECKKKIAVEDLDEIYFNQLKTFFLSDSDIESFNKKSQENINEKEKLLSKLRSEYSDLKRQLEIKLNLRVEGELSKEDFATFYNPVQKQLRQMEAQIPQVEAEIAFGNIQYLSSETIIEDARGLYNNWSKMPFEEKRTVIEDITNRIEVNENDIHISLSYLPGAHHSTETAEKSNASV